MVFLSRKSLDKLLDTSFDKGFPKKCKILKISFRLQPSKFSVMVGHKMNKIYRTIVSKYLEYNLTLTIFVSPPIQIKDINIYECLSDPKNMSGVNERYSDFSSRVSHPMLKKPVKFVYTNGLVQQVFAEADDPDWSVNMKKGIINMLQVDVQGKDSETGLKDFFTKEEVRNYFFYEGHFFY